VLEKLSAKNIISEHIHCIREYFPHAMYLATRDCSGINGNNAVAVAMRYAVMNGGKRLRALFVLEVARMYSLNISFVMPVALAIECIHAYSLVHDDLPCMDDDELRRGLPTLHTVFNDAIAVLAGDALQSFAFALLAGNSSCSYNVCNLLVCNLAEACGVKGLVGGQGMDITGRRRNINDTPGDIKEWINVVYQRKTASLFKFCITASAILGCVDKNDILTLEKVGDLVGIAYQMQDDVLDAIGCERTVGKALSKDVGDTAIAIYGVEGTLTKIEEALSESKELLRKLSVDSSVLVYFIDSLLMRRR